MGARIYSWLVSLCGGLGKGLWQHLLFSLPQIVFDFDERCKPFQIGLKDVGGNKGAKCRFVRLPQRQRWKLHRSDELTGGNPYEQMYAQSQKVKGTKSVRPDELMRKHCFKAINCYE